VGDKHGCIWVLDAGSGAVQRSWQAHVFPVRSIAAAGHLVYSLGKAGSIRAWPAVAPPPELTAAWRADALDCLQQQTLQVGTWCAVGAQALTLQLRLDRWELYGMRCRHKTARQRAVNPYREVV